MFKKLKEKAGYVSIETVVVTGLILALGAYIISELFIKAGELQDAAMDNFNRTFDVIDSISIIG